MNGAVIDWGGLAERSASRVWRAARELAPDDDSAWDCVQEAFLTAVSTGSPHGDPVSWLCGVARNHARHMTRSRRRWIRAIFRSPQKPRDHALAESVLDAEALKTHLSRLPMRERDALILRYIAGMTVPEVAQAQGISEAAAKSRVRRGLARLRKPLGGAGLVLLLVRESVRSAEAAGGAGRVVTDLMGGSLAPKLAGGTGGGSRLLLGLPAAVVVTCAVLFLVFRANGAPDALPGPAPAGGGVPGPRAPEPADDEAAKGEAASGPVGGVQNAGKRNRSSLVGVVTDWAQTPVPGAEVRIVSDPGGRPYGLIPVDERQVELTVAADKEGSFTVPDLPVGPYMFSARGTGPGGELLAGRVRTAVCPSEGDAPLRLLVTPVPAGPALLVLVEDTEGNPIPDADVEVVGTTHAGETFGTGERPSLLARSDGSGRVVFDGPRLRYAAVTARVLDGRIGHAAPTGWQTLEELMKRGGLRVRVLDRGALKGSVLGAAPELLIGAVVRAHFPGTLGPYGGGPHTTVETKVVAGRYRFANLAAGKYSLTLHSPRGLRLVLPRLQGWGIKGGMPNSVQSAVAEVEPGLIAERDLEATVGGILRGRIVGPGNKPVVGAEVLTVFAPRTSNFPDGFRAHGVHVWRLDGEVWTRHPVAHLRTRTGPDGTYEIAGLQPGKHRVEVFAKGLSYDRHMDVEVRDGETTELGHRLESAGTLQATTGESGYVGICRSGEESPAIVAIVPFDGCFTCPGLAAGTYRIVRCGSDARRPSGLLAEVVIAAGRTTWVDLREARGTEIRGRVTDEHGPVAGARVQMPGRFALTDEEGRFSYHVSVPWMVRTLYKVEIGGLEHRFYTAPTPAGNGVERLELELGSLRLPLVTRDVDGKPTPAVVRISGSPRPGPDPKGRGGAASKGRRGTTVRGTRRTDGNGQFTLEHLWPGKYRFTVTFPDGSRMQGSATVPGTAPTVLRAPPRAVLALRVLDKDGRPAGPMDVLVAPTDRSGPYLPVVGVTGPDGEVEFRAAPAGEVAVTATPRRPDAVFMISNPEKVARASIRLEPGKRNTLELVLGVDRGR